MSSQYNRCKSDSNKCNITILTNPLIVLDRNILWTPRKRMKGNKIIEASCQTWRGSDPLIPLVILDVEAPYCLSEFKYLLL